MLLFGRDSKAEIGNVDFKHEKGNWPGFFAIVLTVLSCITVGVNTFLYPNMTTKKKVWLSSWRWMKSVLLQTQCSLSISIYCQLSESCDKYCLCNPTCLILEDAQLNNAIAFAHSNGFSVASNCDKHMEDADGSIVVPDAEEPGGNIATMCKKVPFLIIIK